MTRFADEWETDDLSTLKGLDRPTICVFFWNLPVPVLVIVQLDSRVRRPGALASASTR